MTGPDLLAAEFEAHRVQLRSVAYRMLGSLADADDAVQEAWLRLARADTAGVDNLGGWLTTVVGRICLDMLRSRRRHPEQSLDAHVPDPIVTRIDQPDPEGEAVMADAVGLALMVVLERLSPPERLALVLHDTFAVPYAEIAPMLGRSVAATKQLASRARSRVRSGPTSDDSGSTELGPDDRAQRRQVVQSFLGAARSGDFAALVSLLHPDVILRADAGPAAANVLVGAQVVTARVAQYTQFAGSAREVLVNGSPGIVVAPDGRPIAVIAFHLRGGRIIEIDILADAERLRHLDLSAGLAGQQ
ncbi:MAG: hypothetical protein QOH17_348 [Pseudonocardiales bacterium]|nr:hypothetical protein [Pseudonocardiales bacterium]